MPPKKKAPERRYLTMETTPDVMDNMKALAQANGQRLADYAGNAMREHLEAHYDEIVAIFEADEDEP